MKPCLTPFHELEWRDQWQLFYGSEHQTETLFWEWIAPLKAEDFSGKRVLDAGCGGGHMLGYVEPFVREAVGVDLNTSEIARRRFLNSGKIKIVEGDITTWRAPQEFDIVYSVGVVHHTRDPRAAAKNLLASVRPGGMLALWVYGHEGNGFARFLEIPKRLFFRHLPRPWLWTISKFLTAVLYPVIYSIYSLPLGFLPYFDYFQSWKRLSFTRNATNIFDKLNAPTTHFIKRKEIDEWIRGESIQNITVSPWCRISWRVLVHK